METGDFLLPDHGYGMDTLVWVWYGYARMGLVWIRSYGFGMDTLVWGWYGYARMGLVWMDGRWIRRYMGQPGRGGGDDRLTLQEPAKDGGDGEMEGSSSSLTGREKKLDVTEISPDRVHSWIGMEECESKQERMERVI